MVPSFPVPPLSIAHASAPLARSRTLPPAARLALTAWLALACSLALGLSGCSKPARLTGTFTGLCTFTGGYRGAERADSTWTRTCTLTLEDRSETELAMRFDTGDAIECYGHAEQRGAVGERAASFATNDLTCRAKTLPAPVNIAVEQCTMPGTFELTETPPKSTQKGAKPGVAVKVALDIADKRACVVSYLKKVQLEARLAPGGSPVQIEAFQDAGIPMTSPEGREPPLAAPSPHAPPRDASADAQGPAPKPPATKPAAK